MNFISYVNNFSCLKIFEYSNSILIDETFSLICVFCFRHSLQHNGQNHWASDTLLGLDFSQNGIFGCDSHCTVWRLPSFAVWTKSIFRCLPNHCRCHRSRDPAPGPCKRWAAQSDCRSFGCSCCGESTGNNVLWHSAKREPNLHLEMITCPGTRNPRGFDLDGVLAPEREPCCWGEPAFDVIGSWARWLLPSLGQVSNQRVPTHSEPETFAFEPDVCLWVVSIGPRNVRRTDLSMKYFLVKSDLTP